MADPEFSPEEIQEGRVLAAVGYLSILFILPMVLMPENRFCKAHAKQAFVLFLAASLVGVLSCFLSFLGGGMFGLLIFVLQLIALVKAAQGQFWKIPGAWELSERIRM